MPVRAVLADQRDGLRAGGPGSRKLELEAVPDLAGFSLSAVETAAGREECGAGGRIEGLPRRLQAIRGPGVFVREDRHVRARQSLCAIGELHRIVTHFPVPL